MIQYLQKMKAKRGFTLMELMIVIAVIGVLALILVPLFNGLVQNAQKRSVESGLQSFLDLAKNFEKELNANGMVFYDGNEKVDMDDGNGEQTLKEYLLSQCPEIKPGSKTGGAIVLGHGEIKEAFYREDFHHAGWYQSTGFQPGIRFDDINYGIAPLGDVKIEFWAGEPGAPASP